jgi:tryptophan synthase alpha chain
VTLRWILEELGTMRDVGTPILLMSYLNPLLALGLDRLPRAAAQAGVAGFIVPDLPHEESTELREALGEEGMALIQMVTPLTSDERLAALCRSSRGFVYAVTMTGTTGRAVSAEADIERYLDRVRAVSPVPVCAGFGIRTREQVQKLAGHADGVIVGSALVEALEQGRDPGEWLAALRGFRKSAAAGRQSDASASQPAAMASQSDANASQPDAMASQPGANASQSL